MNRSVINMAVNGAALMTCLFAFSGVGAESLLIRNAQLYADPALPPIHNANILILDGIVQEISATPVQFDGEIIDAEGRVTSAGLWNSHVHFTERASYDDPQHLLTAMLLKYGFTSVVDTGSELAHTLALSRKIENSDLNGPRIFTANGSFVHTDGTPSYLPDVKLPEVTTRDEAARQTAAVLQSGADGIKIFSGSFQADADTIHLPGEIIEAITTEAHRHGTFVISHPQDLTGLVNAVENGVDVLAHTAPSAGPLSEALISQIVDQNVALVPTLTLWDFELRRQNLPEEVIQSVQGLAISQLNAVHDAGGEILFGTDVGFVLEYDTAQEFELMYRAGMTFQDILESLTIAPAGRFSDQSGKIEVGGPGDIVIYTDDPAEDVRNFSKIDFTIRGGQLVYQRDGV